MPKIKSKLSVSECSRIYRTGFSPGKLYGTPKIHTLSDDDGIDKLPIRPIIFNLDTATYCLAKNLAKLLSPLSTLKYTVSNSKGLITFLVFLITIKVAQLSRDYHMVSFDVKSLFTNAPLAYTIELVLEKIYNKEQLATNITRSEMKECCCYAWIMLILATIRISIYQ